MNTVERMKELQKLASAVSRAAQRAEIEAGLSRRSINETLLSVAGEYAVDLFAEKQAEEA